MRQQYILPVDSVVAGRIPLVDHARRKLLYNELASLFDLAVHRDSHREVDAIMSLVQRLRPESKTLIDLGCGVGRHAGLLSRCGFNVTGIDISPAMLAVARKRYPACAFLAGDFRSHRLQYQSDIAIIMWTTFNYLGSDDEVDSFFRTVSANLVEDGLLIVDVANYAVKNTATYERHHANVRYSLNLQISKSLYHGHNIGLYRYHIRDLATDNSIDCIDQEIARVYSMEDLTTLAAPTFSVKGAFGDYDLSAFDRSRSPRIIVAYRHNAIK
jgi:trans-aconitate methyltransferase